MKTHGLSKLLKYASLVLILVLMAIIAVDFIFEKGIIQGYNSATKSNYAIASSMSDFQRIIVGMVAATLFFGVIALVYYSKKSKYFYTDDVLAMFVGTIIIYVIGAIQGQFVTKLPWSAIMVGWVLPFIVGDTIKLLLAAWIAKTVGIQQYLK